MPDTANLTIQPDGRLVSTPPIGTGEQAGYRIALEGTFRYAYTDELIDAVYRFPLDGKPPQPHDFLAWQPRKPVLESEDVANHRYVFRIPDNWAMEGQSFAVGLDTSAFYRAYLVTESDALAQLSGSIQMTVSRPAGGALPAWLVPTIGLPALGAIGGVAWVMRRRRSFGGLDEELARSIRSLQERGATAIALAAGQKRTSRELKSRIAMLQKGAVEVAQRMQAIRRSLSLADLPRTSAEITALEGRLGEAPEGATRHELESALEQKRKALDAAEDLRSAEERCRLRLAKIEGVIDSTCLHLQRANVGDAPGPIEDTVLRELDSEVRAVAEVAREQEQQAYLRVR